MPLEKSNYNPPISISDFLSDPVILDYVSADAAKRLDLILRRNDSDKSSHYNYHLVYQLLLDSFIANNDTVALFEIGIRTNNLDIVSNTGWAGRPGASLKSFRAYNCSTNVTGADIKSRILFSENQIKTLFVDQFQSESARNFLD